MFGFLKRVTGIADAYATGKACEQSYKLAELISMRYVRKSLDAHDPDSRNFSICVWSYLFSTEPRSSTLLALREQHMVDIETEALRLLEDDEPLRELIVSTLWVGLGLCRAYDDKVRFERIMSSEVFRRYSDAYPLLPHDKYGVLVERWAQTLAGQ